MPSQSSIPEFERLAYEAALRALEHQERVVNELRARTGLLIAAASIAVSLLGREAFGDEPHRWLVALSLAAFALTVGASAYVLRPRAGALVFSQAATELYEGLYASRHDLPAVYRALIYDLGDLWAANDRSLRPVLLGLRIGVLALALEIVLLALTAADSLY